MELVQLLINTMPLKFKCNEHAYEGGMAEFWELSVYMDVTNLGYATSAARLDRQLPDNRTASGFVNHRWCISVTCSSVAM